MTKFNQFPKTVYRFIKRPPQVAYALGLGPLIGRLILLLTTTGRVTGKSRITPLQYEEIDGVFWVGATLGLKSDWVRNILADPQVEVRVKSNRFKGFAEVFTDLDKIVEFLEIRLQNHPRMVGAMLKAGGIPSNPPRAELENYGAQFVVVAIHPIDSEAPPSSLNTS
jgi:deazaflavin-dependent oxidoreductase (nitroreductase family)